LSQTARQAIVVYFDLKHDLFVWGQVQYERVFDSLASDRFLDRYILSFAGIGEK
jgi:hypothetical protein